MTALLVADLRALGNLGAKREGRRLLFAAAIGFVLLGLLSHWFADAILDRPALMTLLDRRSSGDSLRGLLGYGLMACPLVATWLGLALAQRQLFEAKELLLWRQAPLAAWRSPLQVLLRATFVSSCQAGALAGPFVGAVLQRSTAPGWAWVLLPVAIVGATMPLLASLLAVQIVLVRFLAGRWLRLLLTVAGALASVLFSAWLLLTLFAPGHEQAQAVIAVAGQPAALPWTVGAGATLLAAAARGELHAEALRGLLAWLAATLLGFLLVARLHAGALERHLAGEPPLFATAGRRWPASLAATVRKKELAQVLQQPGALVGFLVYALLVLALVREQVLVGSLLATDWLPRDVVHTAVMLAQWFLAVLLVLYAHMGRLCAWDGPQWSLFVTAPASPWPILRGKLAAIFVLLLWPLLLVGLAGAWLLPASQQAVLTYATLALGGTGAALGVLTVVGTLPFLMRPDDGGHVVQGMRGILGAMILVFAFYVVLSPAVAAWLWFDAEAQQVPVSVADVANWRPWVIATALGYGALVAALGAAIGARNFRRMLRPR